MIVPTITDYFTPESLNQGGGVTMLAQEPADRKALYLTNQHGHKLLKMLVKSEPHSQLDKHHAQIKLIPYGIKRAIVWKDLPTDPQLVTLRDGVDLTYHGDQKADQSPKVHVKASSGYTTLIDEALSLPADVDVPVPLFSFDTGYANQRPLTNAVTQSCHVAPSGHRLAVRFDLYLASASMDMQAFFDSMYFFNLFWTQEYLAAAQNSPLTSGLIIAPITFYPMGEYQMVVRRSLAKHHGRPQLQFYSNKNYYAKLMNRPTAWHDAQGKLVWSTMAQDDARLRAERMATIPPEN